MSKGSNSTRTGGASTTWSATAATGGNVRSRAKTLSSSMSALDIADDFFNAKKAKAYKGEGRSTKMAEVFQPKGEQFSMFRVNYSSSPSSPIETTDFPWDSRGWPYTAYRTKAEASLAAANFVKRSLK